MNWLYGVCALSSQKLLKYMLLKNAQIYLRTLLHPSRPALGPTQPPVQWVPGLFTECSSQHMALSTPLRLVLGLKGRAIPLTPLGHSWPPL